MCGIFESVHTIYQMYKKYQLFFSVLKYVLSGLHMFEFTVSQCNFCEYSVQA